MRAFSEWDWKGKARDDVTVPSNIMQFLFPVTSELQRYSYALWCSRQALITCIEPMHNADISKLAWD